MKRERRRHSLGDWCRGLRGEFSFFKSVNRAEGEGTLTFCNVPPWKLLAIYFDKWDIAMCCGLAEECGGNKQETSRETHLVKWEVTEGYLKEKTIASVSLLYAI